jgi:hypothetical protein
MKICIFEDRLKKTEGSRIPGFKGDFSMPFSWTLESMTP